MLDEAQAYLSAASMIVDKAETARLFRGQYDALPCILTVYPGAGGLEADAWAMMLVRMYLKYADRAGFKKREFGQSAELTVRFDGPMSFGHFRCERGSHRLGRVSPYDAKGRRHTSFATVEVLPIIPENAVTIRDADLICEPLKRSSGPGGQGVNKKSTAMRITHKPSGIVVTSNTHRELSQNRKQALGLIQAQLDAQEEERRGAELAKAAGGELAKNWGQQIRSYRLYDSRVKDHRTGHETRNAQGVLDGDLQPFIDAELRRRA